MNVIAKLVFVLASIAMFASCAKQEDFSTATGKNLFPYEPVSTSSIKLTKIKPETIKLKDTGNIMVYTYSVKLSPSYMARGYLFEGPEETRKAKGNAILFAHWLGGISAVDTSEWEFFKEAASYARDGNVCIIPLGQHPWMESSTGTADDVPLVIGQVNDYRIGLDLLFSRFDDKPQQAMVIGHDYGAMFSILMAAADSRVGAMVIMAPTSYFYYWNRILRSIPEGPVLEAYKKAMLAYEPITLVKELTMPLLFQYGESDSFVTKGDAQGLIDAATKAPKETRWYPATHNLHRYPNITEDRKQWVEAKFSKWNESRSQD